MNDNSIVRFIDVQLFNKCCEFKSVTNCWMYKPSDDYGKWKDFTIRDLYLMMQTTTNEREMRTLALWSWKSGFIAPDFSVHAINTLAKMKGLDVFLEAFVYNSHTVPKESKPIMYDSLKGVPRATAMETLVAMDALGSKMTDVTKSRMLKICEALLLETGIDIYEDWEIIQKILEIISDVPKDVDVPMIFKALNSFKKSVPAEGKKYVQVCNEFGMSYRHCLIAAARFPSNAYYGKALDEKNALYKRLLKNEEKNIFSWNEIEKELITKAITQLRSVKMKITNKDNLTWLCGVFGSEELSISLLESDWKERINKLEDEDRRRVVRNSLLRLNEEGIKEFYKREPNALLDAFSVYEDSGFPPFLATVEAGVLNEACFTGGLSVYFARLFNGWSERKSFDFLQGLLQEQEIGSEAIVYLLSNVTSVDYDFLSEEEKSFLFEVMKQYYFRFDPKQFRNFVWINKDTIPAAKELLREAGDLDE